MIEIIFKNKSWNVKISPKPYGQPHELSAELRDMDWSCLRNPNIIPYCTYTSRAIVLKR